MNDAFWISVYCGLFDPTIEYIIGTTRAFYLWCRFTGSPTGRQAVVVSAITSSKCARLGRMDWPELAMEEASCVPDVYIW